MDNANYAVSVMVPGERHIYNTTTYAFENEEDAEKFAYNTYQSLFKKYVDLYKKNPEHYDDLSGCYLAKEKQYYIDFTDAKTKENYFASIMVSELTKIQK